ncbi:flagellar assembly factor FliW [Actinoplanes lobatus]|uniref:Flagellar assembly factor FliW n=1 Tax=Actinoplanes lobatus TaxID=113568 RepID=A0A7W7MEI0_9ACTN|nr:flagellar assembly protein FliW [Actinoplanes lobatus]MBB4747334.1 flagellar assembly factor FliW [Actinoplanes lobatus]GGN79291.1 flagellar assembly factor FliW [Actinoplanes lobatus]GIE42695.1 flagellar assembly factor FliW [Actinoplanes lobatus]
MTDPSLGLPTIMMAAPMPGFPGHREFVLVRINDDGLLYALTSIEDPELRFLVAPPEPFFPDYAPEIDNAVFATLNCKDPDRLLLLTVITAGENDTTANLLAPIVLDRDSMRAMQVVLTGSNYPVRAIMNKNF